MKPPRRLSASVNFHPTRVSNVPSSIPSGTSIIRRKRNATMRKPYGIASLKKDCLIYAA
jgi:hypothetical protein